MKDKKILIFLIILISLSLLALGIYFLLMKKQEKSIEEKPTITLPKPTYKIFDEKINNLITYDEKNKYIVVNKIGMKDKNLPELDGEKIYMPFDGRVKYRKMPALGITSDYWWTYLEIYNPYRNVILNIWGSFEPVNLELEKEVFKPKGTVIGEFPKYKPGEKFDVFNDFLVINAFKIEPYQQDLDYLKEIFPRLNIR